MDSFELKHESMMTVNRIAVLNSFSKSVTKPFGMNDLTKYRRRASENGAIVYSRAGR